MKFASISTATRVVLSFVGILVAMACIVVIVRWSVKADDDRATYVLNEKLTRQQLSTELLRGVQDEGNHMISTAMSGMLEATNHLQQSSVSTDMRIDELHSRLHAIRSDSDEQALLSAVDTRRQAYRAVREEWFQRHVAGRTLELEKRLDSRLATAFGDYSSAIYKLRNLHAAQAGAAAMEVEQQFQLGRSRLVASGMLSLALGVWFVLLLARRTRDAAAACPARTASAQVHLPVAGG